MAPAFVPAVIEEPPSIEPAPAKRPRKQARAKDSAVELEIDGVAVKIGRGADASIIAAVTQTLTALANGHPADRVHELMPWINVG